MKTTVLCVLWAVLAVACTRQLPIVDDFEEPARAAGPMAGAPSAKPATQMPVAPVQCTSSVRPELLRAAQAGFGLGPFAIMNGELVFVETSQAPGNVTSTIRKLSAAGEEQMLAGLDQQVVATDILVGLDSLYLMMQDSRGVRGLHRLPKTGGMPQLVVVFPGRASPRLTAVDANYAYAWEGPARSWRVALRDGALTELPFSYDADPRVVMHEGDLWFRVNSGNQARPAGTYRIDLDAEPLAETLMGTRGCSNSWAPTSRGLLCASGSRIYLAELSPNKQTDSVLFYGAPQDDPDRGVQMSRLDGDVVYVYPYLNRKALPQAIRSVNIQNATEQMLACDRHDTLWLEFDADHVYWLEKRHEAGGEQAGIFRAPKRPR